MKNISIIIIFISSICFGQKDEFSEEHISNYDLVGNVKSAIVTNVEENHASGNTARLHTYTHKYSFSEAGFLLIDSLTNNDGFKFLTEKNIYDNKNNLIYKLDQRRKSNLNNGKSEKTNKLLKFEIKNTFNVYDKLLTTHQKSFEDKDFYIVEKNFYSDSLIIESLNINNNVPFQYADSFFRNTLTKYTYNTKGLLINHKDFHDKQSEYYRADSSGVNIIKPIALDDVNYLRFNLRTETFYKYNKNGQEISLKSITHDKEYVYDLDAEKQTEYFGTKLKSETWVAKKAIHGTLYDYVIIENDTLLSSMSYFGNIGDNNLKFKRKKYEMIYNQDGSYKKLSYNSEKELKHTTFYNSNGNIIEFINHETKRTSKYYLSHNDDGKLISEKIENRNSKGEITSILTRKYDKKGNWVYEKLLDTPSNKIRRLIKREITYHD